MTLPKGSIKSINNDEIMKMPFVVFQSHHDDYHDIINSPQEIQQEFVLMKTFFHPKNINLIQKQIITNVFRRTNGSYLIEKQNELDLQIIMKSIFMLNKNSIV